MPTKRIGERLRQIREQRGLSLRNFADWLNQTVGLETSYESIRQYEQGQRAIPSAYLFAVVNACGVSGEWLLTGVGDLERLLPDGHGEATRTAKILAANTPESNSHTHIRKAWRAFVDDESTRYGPRQVILESWKRCRDRGVAPRPDGVDIRRLPDEQLQQRLDEQHDLLRAARPHLRWVSQLLSETPHVAYLTDTDGIVLWSCASQDALIDQWSLQPGADWSEKTMGTNGAGTALETGDVVAVIGAEHWKEPFHECACLAAPIFDATGAPRAAVDLSTPMRHAQPERLLTMAYAASMIEHDLERLE